MGRRKKGGGRGGCSPGAWAAAPGKAGCSRRCFRLRGWQRGRAGYGRCRTSPSRCVPRRRQRAPPPAPSASCASAASPPKTSAAAATGIDHPPQGAAHDTERSNSGAVARGERGQLPSRFSTSDLPSFDNGNGAARAESAGKRSLVEDNGIPGERLQESACNANVSTGGPRSRLDLILT